MALHPPSLQDGEQGARHSEELPHILIVNPAQQALAFITEEDLLCLVPAHFFTPHFTPHSGKAACLPDLELKV